MHWEAPCVTDRTFDWEGEKVGIVGQMHLMYDMLPYYNLFLIVCCVRHTCILSLEHTLRYLHFSSAYGHLAHGTW